ncbi:MAG: hypothetical protein IT453_07565 [Planctomycetes bacterium]|nr:hypothetical protein [Planctomycetota bacterium]
MTDIHAALRSKIDAFLIEIQSLTRLAALDAVKAALSGGGSSSIPTRASRPVARRVAPVARAAAPKAASGKRAKRTTEDVAVLGAKILDFVKTNAGCSVEQIRAGLGLSKKEVALPILRLKSEKRLKTTGQKRGTRYFAGGASPKVAAKAKRVAPAAAAKAKRAAPKSKKPSKAAAAVPKTKSQRKPMAPDQKAALLERLAKARAARAAKLAAAK